MGLILDAVDGLTGGLAVASMSVRSNSAMATCTVSYFYVRIRAFFF